MQVFASSQHYYANFGVLNGPFLSREWSQATLVAGGPLVREWSDTARRDQGLRLLALNRVPIT